MTEIGAKIGAFWLVRGPAEVAVRHYGGLKAAEDWRKPTAPPKPTGANEIGALAQMAHWRRRHNGR